MEIKDYIKNDQPLIYKTFTNAIKNNELSHAYLIIGEHGTLLKETAFYLAKSLLCESPNPLACEKCITCLRVDDNEYSDLIFLNGELDKIKKDDVDYITSTFSRTANEKKGRVIYIIHLVENMTVQAINAILKFLEEPGKETYAFLTTQNEAKVLPTIISRSQRLVLKLLPREEIIEKAKNESDLKLEDIEILSFFYNNVSLIKENSLSERYLKIKECFNEFISSLFDKEKLLFITINKIEKEIDDKEEGKFFIDLLISFLNDVIRKINNENIFLTSYDKIIIESSNSINNIDSKLLELMNLRGMIDLNVSLSSIYEHLAIILHKE